MSESRDDKQKALPHIATDRHALSALICMHWLYRHPLRGRKIHASDPQVDEAMSVGNQALLIEDPTDASKHPNLNNGYSVPEEIIWRSFPQVAIQRMIR